MVVRGSNPLKLPPSTTPEQHKTKHVIREASLVVNVKPRRRLLAPRHRWLIG
jgi:hypothetical protein